jgi:hypothetical protein
MTLCREPRRNYPQALPRGCRNQVAGVTAAGLYLSVSPEGRSKSWGKAREMGLGPHPLISLAEATARQNAGRRLISTQNW